ncbi:xanthine dehydrogenase, molybdenum binding subunit apoprotein [Longilinea arvoryzae]|uniref:Xanthine dehydrogenase, molybdenum binding subunit apoprotein n=1 Tax=Longilinea arvoryzae TaxID=360412 RepID=A0A0S7BJF6_9CHLR|nr:molybdopterin cofactor-binding domain-containing protein [Longilinea arvoryzae]GAP15769.1 xanthine dehydrogenase, molybdenum binding subunit apoprotein [Longilinea arvoryzae]
MKYIGQSVQRIDAVAKVKGEAVFASDMVMPGQAYMKMLMARRPHAILKRIDTSKAEALAGVLTVLTSKDVPCNEFGYYTYDQPVLCGQSDKPYTDRVRFVGDRVAAVVAETEAIAAKARDLIEVEYEDLPAVCDVEEAMQPDAPILHPDVGSNVFSHHKLYNGDIEAGFQQADVIVESVLNTPAQEHAFLQTESGLAYLDEEGRLAVVTTGQWGTKDRKQIAHALGLAEDQVRVIYPMTGGAFGGREDISVQIIVALAVLKLKRMGNPRPVKVVWTREESILGHCKRHPFRFFTRWGATREGKIVAAEVKMLADGGAYKFTTSIVSSNTVINSLGPYEIPNVKVDAYDVYTNNVPRGAFRGFGGPQGVYCAEQMVNKLAAALHMDPMELRMRNLAKEGSLQTMGTPFPPGVTIREVTRACAKEAGWSDTSAGWKRTHPLPKTDPDRPYVRHGLGLACAHKNVGFSYGYPENCTIGIDLFGENEIERAVIRHGASEVGMGAHTVITQMAADALGLPMEKIELVSTDTAQVKDAGSVSASRMTFFIGNAIKEGAEKALEMWANEERPVHLDHTYWPHQTTAPDPETGQCDPNVAYAYTTQAAEVAVDLETGQVKIEKIYCTIDVGKAINPQQVVGQIQGGLVQSVGYSVLENFVEKDGRVLTPNLSTYLVPTVLDIPEEMDIQVLEIPDPRGPWGARGLGEVMNMCLAPAVTAAVYDATGVWFDHFPLTPEAVLNGLAGGETLEEG